LNAAKAIKITYQTNQLISNLASLAELKEKFPLLLPNSIQYVQIMTNAIDSREFVTRFHIAVTINSKL